MVLLFWEMVETCVVYLGLMGLIGGVIGVAFLDSVGSSGRNTTSEFDRGSAKHCGLTIIGEPRRGGRIASTGTNLIFREPSYYNDFFFTKYYLHRLLLWVLERNRFFYELAAFRRFQPW